MLKNRLFFMLTIIIISGCVSVKKIEKLANQGDSKAQYDLGFRYEKGIDVPKDIRKAIYWYELSASQGNEWSKRNLLKLQCIDIISEDGKLENLDYLKQAVSNGNKKTIEKYFNCGFPAHGKLDSYPLIYWAGFYKRNDLANFLDVDGINSSFYQKGVQDGHISRINSALTMLLMSYFVENIGDEKNLLVAIIHEGAAMTKISALKQLLTEISPESNSNMIDLTARAFITKLNLMKFTKSTLRSAIKQEINKFEPGVGDAASFAYGVIKRLNGSDSSSIGDTND